MELHLCGPHQQEPSSNIWEMKTYVKPARLTSKAYMLFSKKIDPLEKGCQEDGDVISQALS